MAAGTSLSRSSTLMHSAPVHRARLRASEPAPGVPERPRRRCIAPTRAGSPEYTGLLSAVNNRISRSGQTPLFQAVSTNRYTRPRLTLPFNEFFRDPAPARAISPGIYSIVRFHRAKPTEHFSHLSAADGNMESEFDRGSNGTAAAGVGPRTAELPSRKWVSFANC